MNQIQYRCPGHKPVTTSDTSARICGYHCNTILYFHYYNCLDRVDMFVDDLTSYFRSHFQKSTFLFEISQPPDLEVNVCELNLFE